VMESKTGADETAELYEKIRADASASGYSLNPDETFTKELVQGLTVNRRRYGYLSCPCRLASGSQEVDRDIICPCDYRDPDIAEYGACFCALYVSPSVSEGKRPIEAVPERRPSTEERRSEKLTPSAVRRALSHPVWRCRVCGYLCARDGPPEVCPICKAKRDRFERFM
jgi:ferredoxin-thioredoxin reductase catalytic chain